MTMTPEPLVDQSVSVVICTRDRPELVRRAIGAVLTQEHPFPIEIVLVFDHSDPDETLASDDDMRRVRVTTNDRQPGLAGARNSGIAATKNSWVAFCDDDDEWLPGKLTAQFARSLRWLAPVWPRRVHQLR
ncbi:MAG: glycosyltransferase family A protein [Acidimicrobiales bacterium]